jgi:hypothetical protein
VQHPGLGLLFLEIWCFFYLSEAPGCSGVTTFADGKIIASESALAIVTTLAALGTSRCMMIQRRRLSDLSSLWHCGPDLMALVATFFLMLGMTEANTESLRVFGCAPVVA